jgi:hypothetical protein
MVRKSCPYFQLSILQAQQKSSVGNTNGLVFSVCGTADNITARAAEFCDGMTLKLWRKRKLAVSFISLSATG